MRRLATVLCLILALIPEVKAAPAMADSVTLRFSLCGGMICIPVTLRDGRSHVLLLDTGNVDSWLMADSARTLGLSLEPIVQDGKNVLGMFRLGAQAVSLHGRALSGQFLAFNGELVGELPPGVEGALAYTMFKDKVVEIDYPRRTIRLLDSGSQESAAAGAELKLITFGKNGPPIVVGRGFNVNGKPVSAQIDTLYTGTLLVYDDAIGDLGLQGAAVQGTPRFFPYTDGGVNMKEVIVESVGFGPYLLARKSAKVYFSGAGKNRVHQPDGLFEATVGNALFTHSVLTLDFHSMRVRVQPG